MCNAVLTVSLREHLQVTLPEVRLWSWTWLLLECRYIAYIFINWCHVVIYCSPLNYSIVYVNKDKSLYPRLCNPKEYRASIIFTFSISKSDNCSFTSIFILNGWIFNISLQYNWIYKGCHRLFVQDGIRCQVSWFSVIFM